MTAKKDQPGYRKNTTDPHPLFGGNPSQYTDDVTHRPESEEEIPKIDPDGLEEDQPWGINEVPGG